MQPDRPASSSGGLPEVARTVGTVSGRPRVPAFGTPALSASQAGQARRASGDEHASGGELIADRAEVTGNRVNRGAGYIRICKYH